MILQHSIALGGSYNIATNFKVSVAYAHDFQNSITGPIIEPFVGKIQGVIVRTTATADTVLRGHRLVLNRRRAADLHHGGDRGGSSPKPSGRRPSRSGSTDRPGPRRHVSR